MHENDDIFYYDDESDDDVAEEFEDASENGEFCENNGEVLWEDRSRSMILGLPDPFRRYWIQNGRLYCQRLKMKGLRSYYERNSVLLYRIVDTQTLVPILGKLFNIGTVVVHAKDKTSIKIVLKNIRNPEAFCDWLDEMIVYERRDIRVNEFAG